MYSFGNGNSNPTVSALPTGVSVTFAGDRLTISGTPTVPGNYSYTITTTGCAPVHYYRNYNGARSENYLVLRNCFANCLCKYTRKYWLHFRRHCNRCNSHRLSCCRPHAECFRNLSNGYRNAQLLQAPIRIPLQLREHARALKLRFPGPSLYRHKA